MSYTNIDIFRISFALTLIFLNIVIVQTSFYLWVDFNYR